MDARVDPAELTTVLDGRWADLRGRLRDHIATLDVPDTTGLSTEQHRALVLDQLRAMARTDAPRLGLSTEFGGGGDIGGSVVAFEMHGFGDLSLMVKAGVPWGLFGGAVQLLGTRQH